MNSHEEQPLRACELIYNQTTIPKPVPDKETIISSDESICTDHMVVATWRRGIGWSRPELKPYGSLSLLPTASCLHYVVMMASYGSSASNTMLLDLELRLLEFLSHFSNLGKSRSSSSNCCQWTLLAGFPETVLVTFSTFAPPSSVLQPNWVFKHPGKQCYSSS